MRRSTREKIQLYRLQEVNEELPQDYNQQKIEHDQLDDAHYISYSIRYFIDFSIDVFDVPGIEGE